MNKQEHNGMKVGDIITTYYKGFWKLERIEARFLTQDDLRYSTYAHKNVGDEYSPMFHFSLVADGSGKAPKKLSKATKTCDAAHCRPISEYIKKADEELQRIKQLK